MTNLLELDEPVYGLTGRLLPEGAVEGVDEGAYVLLPDGDVNSFDPQMREILHYLSVPRSRTDLQGHLDEWDATFQDIDEMVDEGVFWRVDPLPPDDLRTSLDETRVVVTAQPVVRSGDDSIVVDAGDGEEVSLTPASLVAFGAGGEGMPVPEAIERAAEATHVGVDQAWREFLRDLGPLLDHGVAYLAARGV